MKKAITLCTFLLFYICARSQCAFHDIIPVMHGISEAEAIADLSTSQRVSTSEIRSADDGWKKYDYLRDSVYKSSLSFIIPNNNCIKSNQNELYLQFVDDKLYNITLTLHYSSAQLPQCIQNYTVLANLCKEHFVSYQNLVMLDFWTNKKDGEGYEFYPTPMEQKDMVKPHMLKMNYGTQYKKVPYGETLPDGPTEKLGYKIYLEHINLKDTRLRQQ